MIILDPQQTQLVLDMLQRGQEYARDVLAEHDRSLGRSTFKNQRTAEAIEDDIRTMTKSMKILGWEEEC